MKTFVLIATLTAGCGGFERSQGFACETTATCDPGRVCEGGYCILGDREIDSAIPIDAQFDASNDAPGCEAWTPRHFSSGCDIAGPAPIDLGMPGRYIYDTTAETLRAPGIGGAVTSPPSTEVLNGLALVISVDSFTIPAGTTLRVVGSRSLIVASWSTITVAGEIDASSVLNEPGAGFDATCTGRAATNGGNDDGGGGGGGGGGHRGAGGGGGIGDIAMNQTGTAGIAGGTLATPPLLTGGCGSARGGTGDPGFPGGLGGRGGGAVQLTARTSLSITMTGRIHAGGEGGAGGTANGNDKGDAGGGGGGAGGMIGLEAPSVMIAAGAIIAVNGGGGGGGADNQVGMRGTTGLVAATGAAGGAGGAMQGETGGIGAAGATLAGGTGNGTPADNEDGAGGGGGGAGWIVIKSPSLTLGGTLSPSATVLP